MRMIQKTDKILVIVESPNKVKTITKIFKDLGYTNTTVLASVGHTTKIKDNHKSYKNTGIYPDEDFRVDWVTDPEKYKVVEQLKAQAKQSDIVLIASDPDREGESLGNHIKQTLRLNDSQYFRIKYHSITKDAISAALANPGYMDKALCAAAESRQIVDKLIGYSLTPVAKAYVGAKSVGRCQSAGLKLVVDREKEIQNFVPEYYYDLFLDFEKDNSTHRAKYIGTTAKEISRIQTTEELSLIKLGCRENYIVTDIKQKNKKESAKPPFCTATFQQEASNSLGLRVKDAMSCAQKLFEGIDIDGEHTGLITYMRTDSVEFSKDFIPQLADYINCTYGTDFYKAPKSAKKAVLAQEGHEALRVVDLSLTPEKIKAYIKNELLVKVYELIWKRTLAAGMKDMTIAETTYTISNCGHLFQTAVNKVVDPGYRIVYSEKTIKESPLRLDKNEILLNTKLVDVAKQTQPPARYKEATLVKELQKQGIGRPSTYVTIVETVLSPTRNYCTLENKEIVPTEKGIQLASFLDRSFSNIISLDYTKKLEESLDAIASGKLAHLEFLKAFYVTLETSISANAETVDSAVNLSVPTCPNCESPMMIRRSRFGKLFYGCTRYPQCRGIVGID